MILNKEPNTYNMNYDVISSIQNIRDLDNKLFCTFTDLENLDNLIEDIIRHSLEKCTSIRGKELEDTVAKLLKNIDMAGLTFNSDDFINTHTNHELKPKYLDDSVAIYSSED